MFSRSETQCAIIVDRGDWSRSSRKYLNDIDEACTVSTVQIALQSSEFAQIVKTGLLHTLSFQCDNRNKRKSNKNYAWNTIFWIDKNKRK